MAAVPKHTKPIVSAVGEAASTAPAGGGYPVLPEGTDIRKIVDAVLAKNGGVYGGGSGRGGNFRCINPDHPDQNPSLNIAEGDTASVVVTCSCADQFENFYTELLRWAGIDYLPGVRPSDSDIVDWGPRAAAAGSGPRSRGVDDPWGQAPLAWKRRGVAFYPFPKADGSRHGLVVRDEVINPDTGEVVAKRIRPYTYRPDIEGGGRNWAWRAALKTQPEDVREYVGKAVWLWAPGWPAEVEKTPLHWTERESWQGEDLYWPEGEKDAETLRAHGVSATTYPVNYVPDPETLRKHFGDAKRVVIPGDLDKTGFAKAKKRRDAARAAGYRTATRFVDRERFEHVTGRSADKADITDWLDADLTIKEMVNMAAAELAEQPWKDDEKLKPEPAPRTEEKDLETPLAVRLREHIEAHYDLFPGEGDERVFALPKLGGRAEPLSPNFIMRAAKGQLGQKAGALSAAASEAAKVLGSFYEHEEPRRLAQRVHYGPDRGIVLDLAQPGNSKCVVVTATGWRVEDVPPEGVVFKRHGRALPAPARGGSIEELREVLRWKADDPHWPLVKGWMVAALLADKPRPCLGFFGPQGAAKTTTGRIVASVIDPKPPDVLGGSFGKKDDDETKALANYIPAWDNVSKMTGDQADFFSRLVTGESIEKRKLYSDSDVAKVSYRRTAIITGISLPRGVKPDTLDRLVVVQVHPMTSSRVSETALEAEWERAQPRVLAGLLDLAVEMLSGLLAGRGQNPLNLRMSDYAEALYAIDPVLYDAYAGNVSSARSDMAEEDPFIKSVVDWLRKHRDHEFIGTADEARKSAEKYRDLGSDQWWPSNAKSWADTITKSLELLEAVGVSVSEVRRSNGRKVRTYAYKEPKEAGR